MSSVAESSEEPDGVDQPPSPSPSPSPSTLAIIESQTITLIIGALTLVAGLAWNDAFKHLFNNSKYLNKFGPWVYAILVTVIVILIIIFLKPKHKI